MICNSCILLCDLFMSRVRVKIFLLINKIVFLVVLGLGLELETN